MSIQVTYIVTPSFNGNGSITLTFYNAAGTFSFIWNDGITTQNRTNLKSGNYSVTITNIVPNGSGHPDVYTKKLQFTVAQETVLIDRSNIDELLPSILCCIGHKGYEYVATLDKGCNAWSPSFLIRLSKILSGWYPAGYVIQPSKPAYWVVDVHVGSSNNIPFPDDYTIEVPDGTGDLIELYQGTPANITALVAGINANTATTGFSASLVNAGKEMWIYGPPNYAGSQPSGFFIDEVNALNRIMTPYFQGGCKEIIADTPCLNNQQIENILETFKKACSLCVPSTTNSITL